MEYTKQRCARFIREALMKRGGQTMLSLGGSMRLVPASRSPLAVPAATGQTDAEVGRSENFSKFISK